MTTRQALVLVGVLLRLIWKLQTPLTSYDYEVDQLTGLRKELEKEAEKCPA